MNSTFWVDKFVNEIKGMINERNELIYERDEIKKRLVAGEAYFSKRINTPNSGELITGTKLILDILKDLQEKENKIKDIDVMITVKLEAYLGNFIGRVKMPERLTDAGDLIKYDNVYAVPFKSDDDNLIQITPDDVWFLKMIKQAFKATNVTLLEKNDI